MRLTIEKLAYGGDGIARPGKDEPVVFVPRVAAGDEVEVEIVEEKPRFRRGRVLRVLQPGASRATPPCPYYAGADEHASCGGCQYQHLAYDAQVAAKREQLVEALRRIGGLADVVVRDAIAAPVPLGYRNKGTFHWNASAGAFGLVAVDGKTILPVTRCALLTDRADRVYHAAETIARAMAQGSAHESDDFRKGVRQLVVRASDATGDTLAALVVRDGFPAALADRFARELQQAAGVTSVALAVTAREEHPLVDARVDILAGARTIREKVGGLELVLDAETFFQVNTAQAERLYAKAVEYARLGGGETVVDLYCGNGGIALTASKRAKRVVGVEVARHSVERGVASAKANGIENVRFERGPVEDVVKKLVHGRHLKPDVVFLDPPRAGMKAGLAKTLAKLGASRIVYVSCNPATLARDLKALREAGYEAKEVTPVDLFPQTFHLESVTLLERR